MTVFRLTKGGSPPSEYISPIGLLAEKMVIGECVIFSSSNWHDNFSRANNLSCRLRRLGFGGKMSRQKDGSVRVWKMRKDYYQNRKNRCTE